jgi:hypothetical protein
MSNAPAAGRISRLLQEPDVIPQAKLALKPRPANADDGSRDVLFPENPEGILRLP